MILDLLRSFSRVLPSLALPAFALVAAGCERIEPAPETGILLQAMGKFGATPAVLILEKNENGLLFKVKETLEPGALLAEGELAERGWESLLRDAEGPLQAEVEGSVARITQSGVVKRSLVSVTSLGAPESTRGRFELRATRWALYHLGILEHGLEGRVSLVLESSRGARTGAFAGVTTLRRGGRARVAVGTRIPGVLTGDSALGAGRFSNAVDAVAVLSFPTGAGAIEVGGMRQIFAFSPDADLVPRGGRGALQVVQANPEEVVLRDDFETDLRLRNLDVGAGRPASGDAKVKFSVGLAINRRQLVATGETQGSAELRTADGKKARFDGPVSPVQTLLDW